MHSVLRAVIGSAISVFILSSSTAATTLYATSATIDSVWERAASGDTIKLTGAFGLTRLQDKISSKAITLDASKASFTDTLAIVRVDGLRIVGAKFDITAGTTRDPHAAVVWGGSDISFDKTTIVGVGNEGGIGFVNVSDIQVTNSSFTGLHAGIGLENVAGGLLSRNKIFKAYSDGIDIGGSHNVSAIYNSCSGGLPGPEVHPDCIQLWSIANQTLQSDNTVSYNTATGATQGFTSFGGGGGGLRISLLHNKVDSSYTQGIACYECIDSNISFNSVQTIPGSAHLTNIHVIGGSNNIVADNTIGPFVRPANSSSNSARTGTAIFAQTSTKISSSAAAVTEPEIWMLLVTGFGLVGLAVRRRQPRTVAA